LATLSILMTRVLKEAGFELLYASLATGTTIDYIWGFVIEEQAGAGPEPDSASTQGDAIAFPYGLDLMDADLLDAIMKKNDKLTATERFDWGLQILVSGLRSALMEKRNLVRARKK